MLAWVIFTKTGMTRVYSPFTLDITFIGSNYQNTCNLRRHIFIFNMLEAIYKNNSITVHKAIEKAVPELFLETIFNAVESQKAPYIVTIFSVILKFASENSLRSYCLGCYKFKGLCTD